MYQMSCYSNIESHLERAGLVFVSRDDGDWPSGELRLAGERDAVVSWQLLSWAKRSDPETRVEVIDHQNGFIYTLVSDIVGAEHLALTIAERYNR